MRSLQWQFEAFYLYGAVEPLTGESFFLEFSYLNSVCFQAFLNEFSETYVDSLNILQVDNGSAHLAKNLMIPENIILLFLPIFCSAADRSCSKKSSDVMLLMLKTF